VRFHESLFVCPFCLRCELIVKSHQLRTCLVAEPCLAEVYEFTSIRACATAPPQSDLPVQQASILPPPKQYSLMYFCLSSRAAGMCIYAGLDRLLENKSYSSSIFLLPNVDNSRFKPDGKTPHHTISPTLQYGSLKQAEAPTHRGPWKGGTGQKEAEIRRGQCSF